MKWIILILIFLFVLCGCAVESETEIESSVMFIEDGIVEDEIVEDEVVKETLEGDVVEKEISEDKVEDEIVECEIVEDDVVEKYYLHENIMTTYFWIGEDASDENSWIDNHDSAWDELWVEHFGGVDDPECREDYYPCGLIPKENPFYCALPYSDYDSSGLKENINLIPWYDEIIKNNKKCDKLSKLEESDTSIIKNKWIKVMFDGKTAYCQLEDAGPGSSDDIDYVFGTAMPIHENEIGLDVSPAIRDYLGLDGMDLTDWQFVDDDNIEEGPWLNIVTDSDACWIYEGSSCQE